ncbi:MAG: redoxin family protein [Phycisphaerales bacterium]|nr:redoxin family protein [Phycisphaerales bacterium]
MNMRGGWVMAILVGAFMARPTNGQQLNLGDPAPELAISDWIKGEPVELAKGKNKSVFLIEFWATWCGPCVEQIPHVTEMQSKYRDLGLVVIAVAGPGRGETVKAVKRFVSSRGESMGYTIGFDGNNETYSRYMMRVGAAGIPYGFLVDKNGQLIWHGHPGDPTLDVIVDQALRGKYDVSLAVAREQLAPLFVQLNRFANAQDWPKFKDTAREILAKDPMNRSAMEAVVYGYLGATNDTAGLRQIVEQHIAAHGKNADAMNELAISLLEITTLERRQPDLALKAAAAGYAACKGGDCTMIDTYARAVFEIGLVERAIELQAEAVAVAAGDEERESMSRVLDYYKACKSLQSQKL